MKTHTVTLTTPEGATVTYDVPGKRAARDKVRRLKFERALHVGTVISLPVPDDGFTEVHTNVGGTTVWTWKTTPLAVPKRAGRAERPAKADLGVLHELTRKAARVAAALTEATGVDCSDLDFSHAGLPWTRSERPHFGLRLRLLAGGEVSRTIFPDRFVAHGEWVLAVRVADARTHAHALRTAHEVPPAPPMPRQTDDQTATDDQKEEA